MNHLRGLATLYAEYIPQISLLLRETLVQVKTCVKRAVKEEVAHCGEGSLYSTYCLMQTSVFKLHKDISWIKQ